mgnify:CR=1 FL=1
MGMVGSKMKISLFDMVNYFVLIVIGIVTIYPFLNVLAVSLNDSTDTIRGGIHIWPRMFTLRNYHEVVRYDNLITAFKNSVLRTVLGTLISVFCSAMLAYSLSRTDFIARKLFSKYFAITMYMSGGLIPTYMLIRNLHLTNTFIVYILPGIISVWNVFVIRSYIDGLPYSLQESAKLDGANDFYIFFKIVMPLCVPVLATVSLFVAVGHWNSWFDTYIYNGSKEKLTTLQFELMKILSNTQDSVSAEELQNMSKDKVETVSPESIKMAITIVTTLPILCVYPFIQRYFIKGVTLGAVKS